VAHQEDIQPQREGEQEKCARRVQDAALKARQKGGAQIDVGVPERDLSTPESLSEEMLERDDEDEEIPIDGEIVGAQQIPERDGDTADEKGDRDRRASTYQSTTPLHFDHRVRQRMEA